MERKTKCDVCGQEFQGGGEWLEHRASCGLPEEEKPISNELRLLATELLHNRQPDVFSMSAKLRRLADRVDAMGLTDSEREAVAAARGMLLEKFVYGCQDEAYRGNNAIVARAVDALAPIAEGK